MSHGKEVLEGLRPLTKELRDLIPDVYSGLARTSQAAFAAGALDTKNKELIALAIAVVKRCDGCIASHARGAARAGATPQEVAEAVGVTFAMEGGPASVYGPRALAAFMDFYTPRDDGTSASANA